MPILITCQVEEGPEQLQVATRLWLMQGLHPLGSAEFDGVSFDDDPAARLNDHRSPFLIAQIEAYIAGAVADPNMHRILSPLLPGFTFQGGERVIDCFRARGLFMAQVELPRQPSLDVPIAQRPRLHGSIPNRGKCLFITRRDE